MGPVRRALGLLVVAGCSRAPSPAPSAAVSAAPAVSVSVSAVDAAAAKPATTAVAPVDAAPSFLKVAPLSSGPVVVKGYPQNVANGMNEFATHVGFSADSALFVYEWQTGGIGGTRVEILARDGSKRSMHSDDGELGPDEKPIPAEVAKRKAIDTFLADEKIPALAKTSLSATGPNAKGPPLTGTWKYTDITLDVKLVEASGTSKSGGPLHPAHVQVGGAVGSEKPVHPIVLAANSVPQAPPHFATLNGFAMSPDGEEFGLLENTFACEYCIDFEARRIRVNALASLVYNDTGYRHHQKKEWTQAATLFEKAVAADPSAKLAAYNLACAWARTGDARTRDALAYAMTLDETVKARAQKDSDFESVRGEPWFPKP